MFPKKIKFKLEKQPCGIYSVINGKKVPLSGHLLSSSDSAWELFVCANKDNYWWQIKRWNKKPNKKEIEDIKYVVIRSMKIYHCCLEIPEPNPCLNECNYIQ